MNKHLVKASRGSVTRTRQTLPVSARERVDLVEAEGPRALFNFQYSYTEVSSRNGQTHLRANKMRFADGKLTEETFEAELRGDAYGRMVEEANRQMRHALSWFLPWMPRSRTGRE